MKNKFKYLCCCRPSKMETAVKELTEGINKLYTASGQYKKEFIFDSDNENPVDILTQLSNEVNRLAVNFDNTRLELQCSDTEIAELKEEAAAAKKQAEELKRQLEEIKSTQIQQRDAKGNNILEERRSEVQQENDKRLKLVRSLIKFRDQLLLFKENTQDEAAVKLLLSLYRETGRFMSENEIELLNQGGDFSTDYQVAVGTYATDNQELVNTIESTFRDGYIMDGNIIRPQEIVVYTK